MAGMAKRILVVRPGALGDFVVSLPVIAGLRRLHPDARIEVLAKGRIASLALGWADAAGDLDVADVAALYLAGAEPSASLASFDLVVTWTPALRQAFPGGTEIVTVPPLPPAGRAASRFFFESVPLLRQAEFDVPRIIIPVEERAAAAAVLGANGIDAGRPLTAVHPGSGGRRKCWPPHRFAQLIRLLREAGRQAALIEGEADAAAVSTVSREAGLPLPVLRGLGPRELAAVLAACRSFVGNDSGVSHVAAAAGTRVVAIFGPTDPVTWAPAGRNVTVVAARIPCRPCGATNPACPHLRCLEEIHAEDVGAAALAEG